MLNIKAKQTSIKVLMIGMLLIAAIAALTQIGVITVPGVYSAIAAITISLVVFIEMGAVSVLKSVSKGKFEVIDFGFVLQAGVALIVLVNALLQVTNTSNVLAPISGYLTIVVIFAFIWEIFR